LIDETDESVNNLWTEVWSLMSDKELLARKFEEQANSLAWKVQYHRCQATCVKYSIKEKQKNGDRPLCRFRCPWPLRESTSVNDLGDLTLKRSNPYINRWNKAMTVGMRHNIDVELLNNNKQSLSKLYYVTNYATKLQTPMWRRLALGQEIRQGVGTEGNSMHETEAVTNSVRQFFMRWANKVSSDREVSAVEACYHILGYETDFTPIRKWANIYLGSLYAFLERKMVSHRFQIAESAEDEMVTLTVQGPYINRYQAYLERGHHLKELCFWEYNSLIQLHRRSDKKVSRRRIRIPFESGSTLNEDWVQVLCVLGDTALPVIHGYFSPDVEAPDEADFFQR
jgi:hypothetical protein